MRPFKNILTYTGSAFLAAGPFLLACQPPDVSGTKTIYGFDDRVEAITVELSNSQASTLARATLILVDENELKAIDSDRDHTQSSTIRLQGSSYGETYRLCRDERFYGQPSNGFCTGVLVGRNKILTASHCIRSLKKCLKTRIVFDYQLRSDGTFKTDFSAGEVFSCERLAFRADDGRRKQDLLIVDLDRPVLDRDPVDIERAAEVLNQRGGLQLAGFPRGLPKKVVTAGRLLSIDPWSASTDLDSFVGNSGSPVLSIQSGKVLGIMTRGSSDFVTDGPCYREKRCLLSECTGETLSVINNIADEIPSLDPQLRVTSVFTKEIIGNGNSFIEPGETFDFSLTLTNTGARTIESADWDIVSEHTGTHWQHAQGHIDHLAWGDTSEHQVTPPRLSIDPADRCARPYQFRLRTLTDTARTDTPFTVLPGKRVELRHDILKAPVNIDAGGSFIASIELPMINQLDEVFPFIDISHPRPDLLTIAVALPPRDQATPDYWYQQQLSEGLHSPDDGIKRLKGHFGTDFLPYQDVNHTDLPIPAGRWQLRVNEVSRQAKARINQLGFTVASRKCE